MLNTGLFGVLFHLVLHLKGPLLFTEEAKFILLNSLLDLLLLLLDVGSCVLVARENKLFVALDLLLGILTTLLEHLSSVLLLLLHAALDVVFDVLRLLLFSLHASNEFLLALHVPDPLVCFLLFFLKLLDPGLDEQTLVLRLLFLVLGKQHLIQSLLLHIDGSHCLVLVLLLLQSRVLNVFLVLSFGLRVSRG